MWVCCGPWPQVEGSGGVRALAAVEVSGNRIVFHCRGLLVWQHQRGELSCPRGIAGLVEDDPAQAIELVGALKDKDRRRDEEGVRCAAGDDGL